ncbi:MAG: SMP-30/Gluconolactonase/LRE-like region [Thermoanaerobaculia bacterium]|jgi:DNA-binding beta-propeller fold protein YncE|nr:SMP-30/Gluconolactonase/LRE-like region [Thermoanaerobaculia bacterium]
MKPIARIIVIVLAALALAVAASNGPIALDWHQGGSLYVLLKNGSVSVLDGVTKRKLRTIPSEFGVEPVEIFSTRLKEGEFVFVSGFSGRSGAIYQYSADGKPYGKLATPEQGAGFDIDPDRRLLYIISPVTNVLYALSIDQKGAAPKRIAYIREAEASGPLIYDRGRNRVVLGDSARGVLYEVDVTNGSYRAIAFGLGRPMSLAIGPMTRTLYVADALTGKVHIFRLENGAFKVSEALATGLRTLSAVTLGPDDSLIVADGFGTYQLSLKTKKLTRFAY